MPGPVESISGDSVLELRLSRPDRLNAVNLEMYHQLAARLDEVEADPAMRAVVLTGAGRAFCVGADLKAHGEGPLPPEQRREYIASGQRVYRRMQTISKPVVAAVNGHAIGAGMELALSCDYIVAAREAKLRFPEVALGTFVGGGTIYTLADRVGLARAKELVMLGAFVTGEEAERMGLVNRCESADRVVEVGHDVARRFALGAPRSMVHAKRLLGRIHFDRDDAMREEMDALIDCMGRADWMEGIAAFHEKREPRFTGE